METSQIGHKIILWVREYTNNAYTDQMGITHPGYVVKKEIPVTIKEIKMVPGVCDGDNTPKYEGWRAEDKDGNSYYSCWNHFYDTSMTPRWIWEGPQLNNEYTEYNDATQCYGAINIKNGQKAIPDGWSWCEKHGDMFTPEKFHACFKCYMDELRIGK